MTDIKGLIYKITNTINDKKYIGQTHSHYWNKNKYVLGGINYRFRQHIKTAKCVNKRKCECKALYAAIVKYSPEAFKIELICECDPNELNIMETKYILEYQTLAPNGYNLKEGGSNGSLTKEFKDKVSLGVKRFFSNIETRKIQSDRLLNYQYHRKLKVLQGINPKYIEIWVHDETYKHMQIQLIAYNEKRNCILFGGSHRTIQELKEMAYKLSLTVLPMSKIKIINKPRVKPPKEFFDKPKNISLQKEVTNEDILKEIVKITKKINGEYKCRQSYDYENRLNLIKSMGEVY